MRPAQAILSTLFAATAGCTLVVDSAPKRSDGSSDTSGDPDAPEIPEVVDTALDLPDVDEEFVTGCEATAVSAGGEGFSSHTCGLFEAGRVMCWGNNEGGRLGTATGIERSEVPVQVVGLESGVTLASAGDGLSCALDGAGRLVCWGAPYTGTPAEVTTSAGVLWVAAGGGFGCAALVTGDVECFGEPSEASLEGVHDPGAAALELCAGAGHVCAVLDGGAVACWGDNSFGQVGNGEAGPAETAPKDVAGLPAAAARIACGANHTCAALVDGTVWCWGANFAGQLGDGTTDGKVSPVQVTSLGTAHVTDVAAGRAHTCALAADGVNCWGENDSGQLGNGDTGIASAIAKDVIGLKSAATAVAAGADHSCALMDTGALMCWGENGSGQLGDGTTTSWPVPVWVLADCP